MAYSKQTWADLPDQSTPITAARLAHIEQGIFDAAASADAAGGVLSVNGHTGAVSLVLADIPTAESTTDAQARADAALAAAEADAATKYILLSRRGDTSASLVATLDNATHKLTAAQIPDGLVLSFNGLTGVLTIDASDIGAATPADVSNAVLHVPLDIFYTGSAWPNRSTVTADTNRVVVWRGGTAATPPPIGGAGVGAINDRDEWRYIA